MTGVEEHEDERRYEESASPLARALDSRVLTDPVRVLRRKPAVYVRPDEPVLEVVARMVGRRQGCAVVVEDEQVVGIFTERDALIRIVAAGENPADLVVRDVMTRDPECLALEDTVGFALHKMALGGFRHLPLVDEAGHPAGVVSQREGCRYLVGFFPEDIVNQPPRSFDQRPPRHQHGG